MADDQRTDGMLALIPDDPEPLSVDGGLDPGELHLTLLYLGDDVTGWDDGQREKLRELVQASAPGLDPVDGRVIGHSVFNPDGHDERDPTAVYLIGDAPGIGPVRDWARWVLTNSEEQPTPPEQFDPFIPHVSAGEDLDAGALSYIGPVRFGVLRLALAGESFDFPLGTEPQSDQPDTPETKNLTFTPPLDVRETAAGLRGAMAHRVYEGKALDGAGVAWVAEHCGEPGQRWAVAMQQRAEVKTSEQRRRADEEDHDEPEIVRAPPFDDEENPRPRKRRPMGRAVRAKPDAVAPEGAGAPTAELGGGLFDDHETKAMSPDPRAAKLRAYWAHGKGRAKWANSPHPFRTLKRHLAKYVKNPRVLNGLVANVMKLGTGVFPGQRPRGGRKSLDWDGVEVKMADLAHADEAALCDGIDEWGAAFEHEDLSGIAPEDLTEDGDPDAAEGKAAELADYADIGARLVSDDEGDEELESWEEIVARGDQYQMDPDGVMHRTDNGSTEQDDRELVSLFGPGEWMA